VNDCLIFSSYINLYIIYIYIYSISLQQQRMLLSNQRKLNNTKRKLFIQTRSFRLNSSIKFPLTLAW